MSGPNVQAPIVLVHGILGFNELHLGGQKIGDYFRGIREALLDAGNTVPNPPQLNPAGSVEQRAEDLAKYLNNDDLADRQVHLLAHSMGGLDARRMIARQNRAMADRVLTLTTLGTPHHGTPVADVGIAVFGPLLQVLVLLNVDLRGFFDLTTQQATEFNKANPDAPNVRYFSIAGDFTPKPPAPFFLGDLLKLPHDIIRQQGGGANDGLVPVTSATHGQFLGTWPADHFRLINWATNLLTPVQELEDTSILDNYLALIQRLADEGF
jgi:triacylglycerol lipase